MISIKKLINIFMLFGLGLFLSTATFAAGLNLELIEQTPTTVTPGGFVYVLVQVSNLGTSAVSGATVEFEDSQNFKMADGENRIEKLGVISEKNSVNKRFKILVGDNAPLGLNSLSFIIKSSTDIKNTINILVGGSNIGLVTKNFEAKQVAPGGETTLNIEFENLNYNTLKDIVVKLDLSSIEDKVFNLATGSNERVIGRVDSGDTTKVSYNLVASPDAESKPYLIPVTVNFVDDLGKEYTREVLGSIKVFSEPVLSLSLDSQEFFSTGKGTFTFAIANPGTSSIKGTMVEVVDSEGYNVLSGLIQYVGDLNPDDFQTIQSEFFIESETVSNLKLKVTYLDSYNNPSEKLFDIPVSIYADNQIKSLGLSGASKSSSSNTTIYVVFLILLVGTFYFGKKRGKKN
jgi:hypothetical protein